MDGVDLPHARKAPRNFFDSLQPVQGRFAHVISVDVKRRASLRQVSIRLNISRAGNVIWGKGKQQCKQKKKEATESYGLSYHDHLSMSFSPSYVHMISEPKNQKLKVMYSLGLVPIY